MAQARALLGTLKQRISAFIALSILLLLMLRYQEKPPATLSSIVTTGPAQQQQLSPTIDLSSPASPFIAFPLARVCAEASPAVPGLVFLCDNNSGGPGNIRNYILTCVRYAVEAGATALVMPRIRARSAVDLSNIHLGHREFGYLFDEAHFRAALAAACPCLALWDRLEDVPHVLAKVEREGLYDVEKMVERVTPRQQFGRRAGCDQRDLNRHTDRFGQRFRDWLEASAAERGLAPLTHESPRLIRLNWGVLWDWEVLRDGPEFVGTFGSLLRFRADLIELAGAVVAALRREALAVSALQGGRNDSFLGVHLRTEEDALKEWPSFDMQAEGYMSEAIRQGYRGGLAYLASGSETESHKFKDRARSAAQIDVRTKFHLLQGLDLMKLKELTWDQQAVIDFIVLLAADYFVGVSPSSFSINVALKRHLRTGGLYARPWKVGGSGDGLSHLVGAYTRYWDDWLFMYDGMWP
ncbi:hypothetical protein PFICI_01024 [Pestalotiopsis fici W106-1]|uniref:Alternative oxidase n=1 Tax=Pestalotiopsis fici (strain W106-1 / CGMCC3.15140) TaxID=1229662 RepID=W3XPL9_PESFW|nr:uncharacterized protein PFICI_01024 [Pestalotiopsis fici W106-1]ETS87196.1 hypothetical protein PFICI_01024 [Pestalotiopsis fici W106-1]